MGRVPNVGGVVEKAHPLAPGVEVEAGVKAGDVVDQVFVDDGEVAVVEEGGELVAARRDLRARHALGAAAEQVAHRRGRVAGDAGEVFVGEEERRRGIVTASRPHHIVAKLAARGGRLRRDVAIGTDNLAGLAEEPWPLAEEVPGPHIGERAERGELRFRFEEGRGKAAHIADHDQAVGRSRHGIKAHGIGASEADRLLDEGVFAGVERSRACS